MICEYRAESWEYEVRNNYGILNDDGTLHYFIYPYAEYDGHYLKNYGTTEFDYKYSFEEGNDDCGC